MTEKQARYRAHVVSQWGFKAVVHPPVASDRSWVVTATRNSDSEGGMIRDDKTYQAWRDRFAYGDASDLLDLWRSINKQGKNNVKRI